MHATKVMSIDAPEMRRGGRELLSLALMDARNHSLHLAGEFEAAAQAEELELLVPPDVSSPLWELGQVGWFQERWIGRNLQRHRGLACDPQAARLASIMPLADSCWEHARAGADVIWIADLPDLETVRSYLLQTLESTLELLEKTPEDDEALYFYRLALAHEDMHGESQICLAQRMGLPLRLRLPGAMPARAPLWLAATRWPMGSEPSDGFCFDNECHTHEVQLPEFEIDAQVVSWAQFVEFVDDGGYDRPALWQPQGWQWLQDQLGAAGRRAPRYVEHIGVASGAVMQTRFGSLQRMLGAQPVMHVSWWEADAWCRWAGRRLPAEVEWEAAAHQAIGRGFVWGDVWEWTGSSFRAYPGFVPGPWRDYSAPCFGSHKVLRGASFATRARMKNAKFRNFQLPQCDDVFAGFRSCAL
jgi:ergothioneine biosynthesis protein EgtB